jgi:predicted O-methyltransferase YrrM
MIHTSESLQQWLHYLFPGEVPALKELAQMLPDKPIVINIGAGAGTSGMAFLESRPDLFLFTVDVQKEGSPTGSLESEEVVLKDAGYWYQGRNAQIYGDSKDVGREWSLWQVNMVFIDGDHSYEGCAGDIRAWLPHVKPGGIMAIHDYHKDKLFANEQDYQADKPHPQFWNDVDRAVDELLVGKYEQIMRIDSLVAFRI